MMARYGAPHSLRSATWALLLVLPVGLVFFRTFENGFGPVWDALTTPTRSTPSG